MLNINTKKLLLCAVFVFTKSSCMEVVKFPILNVPKDIMQPIAGYLTFVARQNLKNSCKSLYEKLHKEPLFLSPFNNVNYHKFISVQDNYLPLKQIASAGIILKLKIFAARQKDKEMFSDLVDRSPEEGCTGTICMFNFIEDADRLIDIYAREWPSDNKGNQDHFNFIMEIIEGHDCEPYIDLVFAQGIDVNAIDGNGYTVLDSICARADDYTWVLKKLIDNQLCNVNVADQCGFTLLHRAARYGGKYIKILLMSANINIKAKDSFGRTPLDEAKYSNNLDNHNNVTYNLLLTADPFQEEPC